MNPCACLSIICILSSVDMGAVKGLASAHKEPWTQQEIQQTCSFFEQYLWQNK